MSWMRKPGGRLAWMAFYVDDFLSATSHLSAAEVGAYMLLICWYWRNAGPVPDDNDGLRRVCRNSKAEWKRMRPVLEQFFRIEGEKWHHDRIDHELQVAKAISMAASVSGKMGNKSKWKLRDSDEAAVAERSRMDRERDQPVIADGSLVTPSSPSFANAQEGPVSPPEGERTAPVKPPEHSEKVGQIQRFYREAGVAEPLPGVLAKWLKLYDWNAEKLLFQLEKMLGSGKLGSTPFAFSWLENHVSDPWPPAKPAPFRRAAAPARSAAVGMTDAELDEVF